MGAHDYFSQDDIDYYLEKLREENERKPPALRESRSKQVHRKAALAFYLKDCLRLALDLKASIRKDAR